MKQRLERIEFRCLCVLVCLATVGCEVPQPPADHGVEGKPPEPVYVDPESDVGKMLAAAIAQKESDEADAADDDGTNDKETVVKPTGQREPLPAGFVATPINAYFSVKERLDELQITKALQTFRHGQDRKPKDMDEVRKKILGPLGITLPKLKEGDTYIFVPDEGPHGAIMIRQAKK